MAANAPAVLAAAAGVGFGHAVLPDHWVPLAVLGRTRRYPMARIARLSALAGVAHVLVSVVLGGVIVAIGLQFRSTVQSAQDTIIGCVLIATGIGFAALELMGRGHLHPHSHRHPHEHDGQEGDHDHEDHHKHEHSTPPPALAAHGSTASKPSRARGLAAVMVPFGAAASPDLTILPVFLAAATVGIATAIGSLIIFASVTIATIVTLTLAAARGGYEIRGEWLERWGNALTAVVLVAIGALVLGGVI